MYLDTPQKYLCFVIAGSSHGKGGGIFRRKLYCRLPKFWILVDAKGGFLSMLRGLPPPLPPKIALHSLAAPGLQ